MHSQFTGWEIDLWHPLRIQRWPNALEWFSLPTGTLWHTLTPSQEFLDFTMLDSGGGSSVFRLYLVSPMSPSPIFMLQLYPPTAPRFRLKQTLVSMPIWIDIFITWPHPLHLGINSYTQSLEASLHSQTSVLLFSISFTSRKNWILTSNFQYFSVPHLYQQDLGLMIQGEAYI